MIVPATINVRQALENKKGKRYYPKSGELLELPFVDDFSADHFPGNDDGNVIFWGQRQASINRGLGINQPTVGVVSFDGTNEVGFPYDWEPGSGPADTLTSCPINLSFDSDDGIGISFYFQPGGNSSFPPSSQGDSLILEFYAPELDEWFWAWSTLDLSNLEEFTFAHVPITDNRFLKEGFQFRFRNIAALQGLFSVWNLDYVWVDQNNINDDPIVNDVAFVEGPITFLKDYTAMPLSHYAVDPSSRMIEDFSVLFQNLNDINRTLEGNEIVVSQGGNILDVIPNFNEPPISALSSSSYAHSLNTGGSQYEFDASLEEEELIFGVDVNLGTVDFAATSSNNTWSFEQEFFTHYAYDDGSAEAGYAVAGTGSRLALRYTNFLTDSVWAIRIYTMPLSFDFENTSMTIKIWEDNGGVPGEELASTSRQVVYGQSEYQELIVYQFEEPVEVPSGTFFVGYQQSSQSSGIVVGLDRNTAANEANLYFDSGNGWQSTTIAAEASVMIHPLFTTEGYEDIVASTSEEIQLAEFHLFPNPSNNYVSLSADESTILSARIYDLSGRLAIAERVVDGVIDVSALHPGMYLVHATDAQGRVAVKKLVIER